MRFLREIADEDISMPTLLELHRTLTQDALADSAAAGRLGRPAEDIRVVDRRDGSALHVPPDAKDLERRLDRLFAFANDRHDDSFVHPVARAVLLHFMTGYEHPFVDGNGRTARALFYWAMAGSGYWMTESLSISVLIHKAPAQYRRAYLYSETDDNDVTYFLDYNLRVIMRAIEGLHEYLARKAQEMRDMDALLEQSGLASRLNCRQIALLGHMRKHPHTSYSVESHRRSHNVTRQTARTDLAGLVDLDLMICRKRGRAMAYAMASRFDETLRSLAAQ